MAQELSISIVTISFNQGKFLRECIESVASQKRAGIDQYIVVDPGSTDGSREVIDASVALIDCLILERDNGPSDGLNKGFALATGDIYGYINADDRLAPGAMQFVRDFFAQNPSIDVLLGSIRMINEEGDAGFRKRSSDRFDVAKHVQGFCNVFQQGTFFRRTAFSRAGGFHPSSACWDSELVVDMALAGCRFRTVNRVLGDFRLYPTSISGSGRLYDRWQADLVRIRRKVVERGVRLYPQGLASVLYWCHRLSPMRQLRYLVAR